jgi:hypothetical protein
MTDAPIDNAAENVRLARRALDLMAAHLATLRTLSDDQLRTVAALLDDTEEMLGDTVACAEVQEGTVAGMCRDAVADRRRMWRALDAAARRMAPGAEREAYERIAERYSV